MKNSLLMRYKEIIISISVILGLLLVAMWLGFDVSKELESTSENLNLAGRQSMLSQKVTKTLLELSEYDEKTRNGKDSGGRPQDLILKDLNQSTDLFNTTLRSMVKGGRILTLEGEQKLISPISSENTRKIYDRLAEDTWDPLYKKIKTTIANPSFTHDDMMGLVDLAQIASPRLVNALNDASVLMEQESQNKSNYLHGVQYIIPPLVLFVMIFLVDVFFRKLRKTDEEIFKVNKENKDILASVREGLFLLNTEMNIGQQISHSTIEIFGEAAKPGANFMDLIGHFLEPKVLLDTRDYSELLFSPHTVESLIQTINPLTKVEIRKLSGSVFISFKFRRIVENNEVVSLLVTAQDITPIIELEQQLVIVRSQAQKEIALFMKVLDSDGVILKNFLQRASKTLEDINELLRNTSSVDMVGTNQAFTSLDKIYRLIHGFKGDAASLGLDIVSAQAHNFENEVQKLKDQGIESGDSFIEMAVQLEGLFKYIKTFQALSEKQEKMMGIRSLPSQGGVPGPPVIIRRSNDILKAEIEKIVSSVAQDVGKSVKTNIKIDSSVMMTAIQKSTIFNIVLQLVKNSVCHGIEFSSKRIARGKTKDGNISVSLETVDGNVVLSVSDDGEGLSETLIRDAIVGCQLATREEVDKLSAKEVMSYIFKPGFSTAKEVTLHSGRGVGLDVVANQVREINGKIALQNEPGNGLKFKITV